MTTPLWCLAIVAVLPLLLAFSTVPLRIQELNRFDNNHPRNQYAQLTGLGHRIWAAQQNAWESLGLFSAVVLINHLGGGDAAQSAIAAQVYLGTRILHPILYAMDMATLRSIVFVIGGGCCVYLVALAAQAG